MPSCAAPGDNDSVTNADTLPDGVLDDAFAIYQEVQKRRVEACYVRNRAVFAEFLVARLLGAEVVEDPVAAWDVVWTTRGARVCVQVKCSGEYIPRYPNSPASARWELKVPKYGFHIELGKLPPGHHCDLFVLARHEGRDIGAGWSFAVLARKEVDGIRAVTPAVLEALGVGLVKPSKLKVAARRALRR
jgi:hypothetical protein